MRDCGGVDHVAYYRHEKLWKASSANVIVLCQVVVNLSTETEIFIIYQRLVWDNGGMWMTRDGRYTQRKSPQMLKQHCNDLCSSPINSFTKASSKNLAETADICIRNIFLESIHKTVCPFSVPADQESSLRVPTPSLTPSKQTKN